MSAETSTTILAWAPLAEVVLVGALVAVTVAYAKATNKIAAETKEMARASWGMLEETRSQQLAQARPLVVFRPGHVTSGTPFGALRASVIELVNIGIGPALDVRVRIAEVPPEWGFKVQALWGAPPLALGVGDVTRFDAIVVRPEDALFNWIDPQASQTLGPSTVGVLQAKWSDVYDQYFRTDALLVYNTAGGGFFLRPQLVGKPAGPEKWDPPMRAEA